MNWGFVLIIVLGIAGAALIAGGIVLFRGNKDKNTNSRAIGAACVAAGAVMLVIVSVVVPVSSSTSG